MNKHIRQFLEQFSPGVLVGSAVASVLAAAFGRGVTLAYGVAVQDEALYWAASTLLVFVILAVVCSLLVPDSRPKLNVSLRQVATLSHTGEKGGAQEMVSLVATIINKGAPTAIQGLRFTATPPGGISLIGSPQRLVGDLTMTLPDGTTQLISGDELLLERAQCQPIPKGGIVWGSMIYAFEKVAAGTLSTPGTVYQLAVRDVWGNECVSSMTGKGVIDGPIEFPTMRPRTQ